MLGLGLGLTTVRGGGFNPASLFAKGEKGFWFDPSDRATLFQDHLGTTPVTAAGQSVGLHLDKSGNVNHATQETPSKRKIYGVEPKTGRRNLLTYSGNTMSATWKGNEEVNGFSQIRTKTSYFAGDVAYEFVAGGAVSSLNRRISMSLKAGTPYVFSIWVEKGTSNVIDTGYYFGSMKALLQYNWSTGVASGGAAESLGVGPNGNSMVRLSFNHTPVSDEDGGLYVYPVGISSTVDSSTILHSCQIEVGTTPTTYQRVVSQYDVTESGVPSLHYLWYDGVDDAMQTQSIDFTATDKMSVFAGVRKLSDAGTGTVVESVPNITSSGAIGLQCPANAGISNGQYRSNKGGIVSNLVSVPPLAVITGLTYAATQDIRVNGVIAGSTQPVAVSTFGNLPMCVGARDGISLFFNGKIYGLIVRGAASTAQEISATENYLAGKSGVTL